MADIAHILKHDTPIIACAFLPLSDRVSTISADTIKIWDGQTGEPITTIIPSSYGRHNYQLHVWVHSHDGPIILRLLYDTTVKMWDRMGTCRTLAGIHHWISGTMCGAASPDGTHLAVGMYDCGLHILNIRTNTHVRTILCDISTRALWAWWTCCYSCCYSSDGLLLACASADTTVNVWNPDDGTCVCTLRGHTDFVYNCVFSPRDPTLLATKSGDRTVKLWHARTGVCLRTLVVHETSVNHKFCRCVFSQDGVYLATTTTSSDRTTKIWNVYTGICVHVIQHGYIVTCCDFSSDGSSLVTSSIDSGTAHIWPLLLRNHAKLLLLVILHGTRYRGLRLPTELWDWIHMQWFC